MAEEFKDIISTQSDQIEDINNMAQVQLEPVYGDAMRQMKKTAEVRDKMINQEIDTAKKKDGPVESKIKGTPEQRKMHLSESLFEDWDDEDENINRKELFNKALKLAKEKNKPVIYGYKSIKHGFIDLTPMIVVDNDDVVKDFKLTRNPVVIYTAYPDKNFIEEALDEDVKNISDLVFDVYYGDKHVDELTIAPMSDIDHYYKIVKSVDEAEKFNYHSDYWGYDDEYQEQNVELIDSLSPYINKMVEVDYDDGSIRGKLLGIAVDRDYNSINHTKIVLDEIKDNDESLTEDINDSNKYEAVIIVYNDGSVDEDIQSNYYDADAYFAELNDKTDDELAADGIIGFLQITTDEDGNRVLSAERVVGNDLNDTKRVEEVANKYLLNKLRESNDKYEDTEYQFKIVLDVEPDSDLELQKLTHHMDYLVDTAEYDLVFSGVNVNKNVITGYVSGSDIDKFEDAIDISDWPEINKIESIEVEKENLESLTEAKNNIESKLYDELSRIWAGKDEKGKIRHAEVYSNPLGNGYKIETELKSVIDEASKIADKYNLPYTARKFRDYYLFTVDLPETESLDEGMSWEEIQAEINKDRQMRHDAKMWGEPQKKKEAEIPDFIKNQNKKSEE